MKFFHILLLILLTSLSCTGTFKLFPKKPGGIVTSFSVLPSATLINKAKYEILGKSVGKSSTFYFLGSIPFTKPLDIDYALSQALTKIPKGQSIINLEIWIEKQYFFPVGTVISVNVKGDVIRYL